MLEVDNVLRILKEARQAIERGDNIALKELSNQTIHTASVSQDPDNIAVAVIVYSISKIIERKEGYQKQSGWKKFYNKVMAFLDDSIDALSRNDQSKFAKKVNEIRKDINKLSTDLKKYIQDVFQKASINKASKIYEHGISMEKTADLLGVSLYDLASYSGQKGIETPEEKTASVRDRIKFAMRFFG